MEAGLRIAVCTPGDEDDLFVGFSEIVEERTGYPQAPPLTRAEFDDYWLAHTTTVQIARVDGAFAGAYYLKPNFVGRAAHIANAGYIVTRAFRGRGYGRTLVEHSIAEAPRHGFDALQFNLVFESNPARAMYRDLGFAEIGRIPDAVEGEAAIIYWRKLSS